MNNTIHVTGSGAVHLVPDVTRLEITIDRVYETYEDAYLKAKENSKWICNILEYNGSPQLNTFQTHQLLQLSPSPPQRSSRFNTMPYLISL